jgi:predicted ATPase
VVQICRRLDGIPLALELAAARVVALTPAQVLDRLDQSFRLLTGGSRVALPRQQTLQAALHWSYDLLVGIQSLMCSTNWCSVAHSANSRVCARCQEPLTPDPGLNHSPR